MKLQWTALFLLFLLLLVGCKKEDDGVTSCSFYEEHFGGLYNSTYVLGEKASQRFNITNGFSLKKITLEMDLLNSQTVTLSVYKAVNGQSTPAGGNLLGQSTITSSNVANTGKIEFPFNGVSLGGEYYDYYLIIEATGGSFEMTSQYRSIFNIYGEIWGYSSGTWTRDDDYDFSFSLGGNC